jgi:serine/threonine protein kinase
VIRGISPVGPAADVYALGAVGWFLLTGRDVFEGTSVVEICAQHLTAEPQPPSKVSHIAVNVELESILLRCLAKDPAERFRSGRELSAALAHLRLDGWSWKQARRWWDNHSPASQSEETELSTERTRLDIDVQARHTS